MSYQNPTLANDIAITSGPMALASGDLTIEIGIRDAKSLFLDEYRMDVMSFDGIEMDFDFLDQVKDIDSFKMVVPSVSFQIQDTLVSPVSPSSPASFMEIVTALRVTDLIVIKVTFNSRSDYFFSTRDQVGFDVRSRKAKIEGLSPVKYNVAPYNVQNPWGEYLFHGKTETLASVGQVVFPKTFIQEYLNHLSQSPISVFRSDVFNTDYTDVHFDNQPYISFLTAYNEPAISPFNDFFQATTVMKTLALSDAAIMGNMLGYAFYVPRYSKDLGKTFTADNFLEIGKTDFSFRDIRQFSLRADYGPKTTEISVVNEIINDEGTTDVSIDFRTGQNEYGAVIYVASLGRFETPGPDQDVPSSSARQSVINAYKDVFRIPRSLGDVDAGVKIEGKIIGATSMGPHEYFSVFSGVHPSIDGRDFRPSYLKYDLVEDVIEFEAYEF